MTNQENRAKAAADLRQKAEALARERAARTSEDSAALSPGEIRKTLHELRVHQIELEMQNEELRTAQDRIEDGRARYYDLYDLAPVGYCTLSEQGLILEANLTVATLLGTTRGMLVKQPLSRFILKDDQTIFYLHRKKLFETGEPQECELRLVKKDGTLFWAHLTVTAAQAEDGTPLCRVVFSDVTERKQAEDTLRKSEHFIKSIIHFTHDIIAFKDNNFIFRLVNPAFCNLVGKAENDIIGKTDFDIFPYELAEKYMNDDKYVIESGQSINIEEEVSSFNGILYVSTTKAPVLNDNNACEGIVIIVRDITERKRAEKALHESEVRFKGIYETSPIGIELYDVHGDLILANPACLEIFGVSAVAEVKGFNLFKDPNVTDDVKAKLSRGETAHYDFTFDFELVKNHRLYKTHRSGTMDLNVLITPIIPEGKVPVGYLVHIQDITERVRLQHRLHLLEKNESLKLLTGAIAHLFNNQLSVVIGNLELLSEDLPSGAIGSENLMEAQTAAHRAAETSGLMLTFLGQSQGKPMLVDFVKACRQCLAGLETDRPVGAEIRCDLPDSGPVIRVDRLHLNQIISALVTNALESMDKAGEVRVSINTTRASDIPDTHRFPLDWEPNSETYACLRVADTGCGMNDTTIDRIFDPFFTDKFMGRGLGLAVVLGIVKASKGCVTVESKPGRGSVFQVMWPLSNEKLPLPPHTQ